MIRSYPGNWSFALLSLQVVILGLRRDGQGVASNVTQKLVRDRRSTRRGRPAAVGDTHTDHYVVESELGQGCFGAVSQVYQKKTKQKYDFLKFFCPIML